MPEEEKEAAEEVRRLEPEAFLRSPIAVGVSEAIDRCDVVGRHREGNEERNLRAESKAEKQLLAIAAAIARSLRK